MSRSHTPALWEAWGGILCHSIGRFISSLSLSLSAQRLFQQFRFRSRFPGVRRLWSDAGTNFVGAAKLLEEALSPEREREREEMNLPIEWQRIPPHASHRAGVWERLIQSIKRILA